MPTAGAKSREGALVGPDGGTYKMVTTTDANGSYQLLAPPIVSAIHVEAPGYLPQAPAVTVVAGQTVTLNVQLTPATATSATITGKVTDADSGAPIAGALVQAFIDGIAQPMNATLGDYIFSTQSDAEGNYSLKVPAVTKNLGVYADGYDSLYVPINPTPGETLTVNAGLHKIIIQNGTLTGIVSNADTGAPIKGAFVGVIYGSMPMSPAQKANSVIMPPPIGITHTDEHGAYILHVSTDAAVLVVYAEGFDSQNVPVTVVANQTTEVNVKLKPLAVKGYTVSGKVVTRSVNGDLHPVAGATVYFSYNWPVGIMRPTMIYSATTDADGSYSIVLPPAPYTVYAMKTTSDNTWESEHAGFTLDGNLTRNFLLLPASPIVQPL